jgi:hypothetical protein
MLEILTPENISHDVHRFANLSHIGAFAEKKGLTMDEVIEVIRYERDDVIKELMDGPFERKPRLGNKFGTVTRFSDGEWPVFYAAVGRTTAQKESFHHYGKKAAGARRAVYYSIVRCRFSGEIMDLRPQLPDWTKLISNDYTFCNSLGREANDRGLGGFLSPSAQHEGGTTAPTFIRRTLSGPEIEATARLTFDAGSVGVEISEVL